MVKQLKRVIRRGLSSAVRLGNRTRVGHFLSNELLASAMDYAAEVSHDGTVLRFSAPNWLTSWRAQTFASKEPETLQWIDAMPEGAVLWDVGANVGLYSVYAAKRRNCRVWAFEPSVFNLELLARNLHLNGVTERVCIVPLALTDAVGSQQMRLTTTEWGGALSTFGRDFGWDGKPIRQVFQFQTMGLTMDDAMARLGIPTPAFLKMDVDGLEHFILKGGPTVLSQVQSVLIEVNDNFTEQASACHELLAGAGLRLSEKRHSDMMASSVTGFDKSYNQIWVRG